MTQNPVADPELERYRTLLDTPTEFKDGFGWTTVAGILFCGLIMMPGGIYLNLMTGASMGAAAQWVTVILFMEISRRAMQPLSRQNLVVLLHAAYVMLAASAGGPIGDMVFRAYLVGSDAVRDAGMLGTFPHWFAPSYDSPAITQRNLFHLDWFEPIMIALFVAFAGVVARYTLGYFFFRVTSDVERLPFPMAPVAAQGTMALAEGEELEEKAEGKKGLDLGSDHKKRAWRLFSLGTYMGMAFGILQVGLPCITGLFLAQPVYLIPQPFVDLTTSTQSFLPAAATGVSIDLGIVLLGFVLPYWAVMGTFAAILITLILNPTLHHFGILETWQPGMNTVNTTFSNNRDFWLSFGIGSGIGITVISIFSLVRDLGGKFRQTRQELREGIREVMWTPPRAGRGDYPLWIALLLYILVSGFLVCLISSLLGWQMNLVLFLVFFVFLYLPIIAYVNARLLGIAGQSVDIPYVKELGFLASGAQGIDIWLAPIPGDNYGYQAQSFRVNELTGVTFWSLIKTEFVALPVLFLLSWMFWGFIWHSTPIPSPTFPASQISWELESKNRVLLYSSTSIDEKRKRKPLADTEFGKALKPAYVGTGFLVITGTYAMLSSLGLPVMLVYGLVRGFGSLPHGMVLEVLGAVMSRYYFQRKYGAQNFLRMAPTIFARYLTGVGLIGMATVALRLIYSAISPSPF